MKKAMGSLSLESSESKCPISTYTLNLGKGSGDAAMNNL